MDVARARYHIQERRHSPDTRHIETFSAKETGIAKLVKGKRIWRSVGKQAEINAVVYENKKAGVIPAFLFN